MNRRFVSVFVFALLVSAAASMLVYHFVTTSVSKTEVLVNGKAPGDTSLILWDLTGQQTIFNVHVTLNDSRPDAVRGELQRELAGRMSISISATEQCSCEAQ